MKKGFTLIELLISIAVLGILGLIFTAILIQVLRGQTKVGVVSEVKQNGQNVLDKLSNEIRSADRVICVGKNVDNTAAGVADDTIVILKKDGYTRFRFYYPNFPDSLLPCSGTITAANGCIKRNDFTKDEYINKFNETSLPITDETKPQLCSFSVNFGNQVSSITDTDVYKGVSIDYDKDGSGVTKAIFEKNSQEGYNDIITIRFRASNAILAGQTQEGTVGQGGVLFATTVQVRGQIQP